MRNRGVAKAQRFGNRLFSASQRLAGHEKGEILWHYWNESQHWFGQI
jgi:hypothetical protein